MLQEMFRLAYLFFPMLIGAIVHGLCLRYGWLAWMAVPVDRGAHWRGKPVFGRNKTWRGILTVAASTTVTVSLQARVLHGYDFFQTLEVGDYASFQPELMGFAFGFCAQLSELPNSFLKRRLGIAPGKGTRGVREIFFYVLDQVDLLAGSWIALAFFIPVTPARVALSIVLILIIHQVLSITGYFLGMRKTLR